MFFHKQYENSSHGKTINLHNTMSVRTGGGRVGVRLVGDAGGTRVRDAKVE